MNERVLKVVIGDRKEVKSYRLFSTSLCNEFSHGFIYFDHEISVTEKLDIIDALSKISNGSIAGKVFGNCLAVFNEGFFSRARINASGKIEFARL